MEGSGLVMFHIVAKPKWGQDKAIMIFPVYKDFKNWLKNKEIKGKNYERKNNTEFKTKCDHFFKKYNKMCTVILKAGVKGIFNSRARKVRESFMHTGVGEGCGEETLDQRSKDRSSPGSVLRIFSNSLCIYFKNFIYSILFAF